MHYISGGSDDEQKRDGDWLDHDQRYARTDEYLDVLRKVWTSDKPFDHEGAHYRFQGAFSEVKPLQTQNGGRTCRSTSAAPRRPRSRWPASTPMSMRCGASRWTQARELTGRVRAEAAKHGRSVRFSVSFRPILAETEEKAWARADAHPGRDPPPARACRATAAAARSRAKARSACSAAAEQGHAPRQAPVDRRSRRRPAARSNSTALVGTPEQVAEALLDYYALGVTTFLIRGFDPLEDAIDYGRELIPRTRALVAAAVAAQRKAA